MIRSKWTVKVVEPDPKKRQRSLVLVRYPPSGAVDEKGRRLRSQRSSSGTCDLAAAQAEAQLLEDRLNSASGLLCEGGTIEAIVRAYLTGSKLSKSHRTNCTSALKASPTLASLPIGGLTRAKLRLGRDQMTRGRANSTVNGYLKALKAAWNWAAERDLVDRRFPKIKPLEEGSTKRPYSPAEVQQVLDWLEANPRGFSDWFSFFSLLADTGLRPGELLRLQGQHVDLESCSIFVTRNKSGRHGKPREEAWVRVPAATIALLPVRDTEEWLWPSRGVQAYGHVTVNGARGALHRALEACGLTWRGKLDQVSFRRWWVDAADEENVSKGDAMQQVGHKKLETHMRYRRNSLRRVPQEVVEKVYRRRIRSAQRAAPQQDVEHSQNGELSRAGATAYAASSDCSR